MLGHVCQLEHDLLLPGLWLWVFSWLCRSYLHVLNRDCWNAYPIDSNSTHRFHDGPSQVQKTSFGSQRQGRAMAMRNGHTMVIHGLCIQCIQRIQCIKCVQCEQHIIRRVRIIYYIHYELYYVISMSIYRHALNISECSILLNPPCRCQKSAFCFAAR